MKKVSATLVAISIILSSFVVYGAEFKDLDKSHWAYNNILKLKELNVINGYNDNTIKPENPVARSEFAKLFACVYVNDKDADLGLAKTVLKSNFSTPIEGWYEKYIVLDAMFGLIVENDQKVHITNIDDKITRGEIAVMIARAIGESAINNNDDISDKKTPETAEETTAPDTDSPVTPQPVLPFSDQEAFANIKNEVLIAYQSGIINGLPDGTFQSEKTATRAEAATMIDRYINFKKLQSKDILYNNNLYNRMSIDIDAETPKFTFK